jgi:hypothetical protein
VDLIYNSLTLPAMRLRKSDVLCDHKGIGQRNPVLPWNLTGIEGVGPERSKPLLHSWVWIIILIFPLWEAVIELLIWILSSLCLPSHERRTVCFLQPSRTAPRKFRLNDFTTHCLLLSFFKVANLLNLHLPLPSFTSRLWAAMADFNEPPSQRWLWPSWSTTASYAASTTMTFRIPEVDLCLSLICHRSLGTQSGNTSSWIQSPRNSVAQNHQD